MAAILPDLATQVLVPAAAVVGIAFAVVQWVLVSKVKMTAERRGGEGSPGAAAGKDGGAASEYLIEEEEGLNDHNVVVKCHEIQTAISEGESLSPSQIWPRRLVRLDLIVPVAVSAETMRLSRVLRGDYLYY